MYNDIGGLTSERTHHNEKLFTSVYRQGSFIEMLLLKRIKVYTPGMLLSL